MEKNKLVIGGIIAVVVVAAAVAFVFIERQEPTTPVERQEPPTPAEQEPPVPVEQEPPAPAEQQEPFVQDMTIESEFCRTVITRDQLREIIDYQGKLVFTEEEDRDPDFGSTKTCNISTGTGEPKVIIGVASINFETGMNKIKLETPEMEAMLKELDNVGEKAVIMEEWGVHVIFFSDRETNRLVAVSFMGTLTREDVIKLARQVEANIR